MSGFKSIVAKDNEAVFLNLEEFAGIHDLNGVKCRAILQNYSVADELSSGQTVHFGLYNTLLLVNCLAQDLPEIPAYGQTFRVDGKLYMVQDCAATMGILTIKLEANDR